MVTNEKASQTAFKYPAPISQKLCIKLPGAHTACILKVLAPGVRELQWPVFAPIFLPAMHPATNPEVLRSLFSSSGGRFLCFRTGFRSDFCRGSAKIAPPAGLRPAGGAIFALPRQKSGRKPVRKLLKDPGVLLKDPGVLYKDPGVLFKDPGVLFKDPGVLLKDPRGPFKRPSSTYPVWVSEQLCSQDLQS